MTRYILGVGIAIGMAAGCASYERGTPTSPSSTGIDALTGTWGSSAALPSRENCSNFQWSITERTATSARGTFSATCRGDLNINGSASATLTSANGITWNADATATNVPALGTCPISLRGTAELGVDSVLIRYSGEVCGVTVSGAEPLRRR